MTYHGSSQKRFAYTFAAVLTVLVLLNVCIFIWHRPGTVFLFVIPLLAVALFALKCRDVILDNMWVFLMFLPGARLLSRDFQDAQQGRAGHTVAASGYIILFLCILGLGGVTASNILPQIGFISPTWDSWWWQDTPPVQVGTRMHDWIVVLLGAVLMHVVFALVINSLVALTIRLGHDTDVAKNTSRLMHYFGISQGRSPDTWQGSPYWKAFSHSSQCIYGHKAWAGQKTFRMLQNIQSRKDELGTSLWMLLESAAEAMDQSIDDTHGVSITYDSSDHDYSRLLARTIDYSSHSIIWLADENDLVSRLFPSAVRETMFSLAEAVSEGQDNEIQNIMQSLEILETDESPASGWDLGPAFCAICAQHNGADGCDKRRESCNTPGLECNDPRKSLLDIYETWARCLVAGAEMSDLLVKGTFETLWKLWNKRDMGRCEYPHVRKYYTCRTPKARLFQVPSLGSADAPSQYQSPWIGKESQIGRILARLIMAVGIADEKGAGQMEEGVMLDSLAQHFVKTNNAALNRFVFCRAWALFAQICKSDIVGFAELADIFKGSSQLFLETTDGQRRAFYDAGIYDGRVFVSSVALDAGTARKKARRRVRWTILEPSAPILDTLKELAPISNGGSENERGVSELIYPLDRFARELRQLADIEEQ